MYETISAITNKLLDSVRRGDLIKCNDWKSPLRVKASTENFFVMARPCFGKVLYSVCEKRPSPNGKFWIGPDDRIFGSIHGYEWKTEKDALKYLDEFERGEHKLSGRRSSELVQISIKRGNNAVEI